MSDDIFVEEEETQEKETKQTVNKKREEKPDKAPPGYLKVKLSSAGKLSLPKVIYVKDYDGEDATNMAMATEENILDTILTIAEKITHEGIDADYMHEKELSEILLNVHNNFWGSLITDYPYPWEEEELESVSEERKKNIKDGKEVPKVDIPISKIAQTVKTLPEDFKEPFTLKDKSGKKVTFKLSRLGHTRRAQKYIEDKYYNEEQKFFNVTKLAEEHGYENLPQYVDHETLDAYRDYVKRRNSEFLIAQSCQVIEKINSKKYETFEEKMKGYYEVGLSMWKMYANFVNNHANFGVGEEIEVESPLTGKKETRRFEFRLMDFIPPLDDEHAPEYTVSYEE